MDPKTKTLMREGVESITNPFDLIGLEAAIKIKKEKGGSVTALSMGPPQALSSLREAMARGADRAILLTDRIFAGADTLATSYTLSRAIEDLAIPYDLILCGLQAIDGDTGQVGPGLAEFQNIPILPNVVEIKVEPVSNSITIHRQTEEGIEVLKTNLPALVIAERGLAEFSHISKDTMLEIPQEQIEQYNFNSLGGEASDYGLEGSATCVDRIGSPKPIGHRRIDPNLHYQERISSILTGGLAVKENKYLIKNEPAERAVDQLVERLKKNKILGMQWN